MPNLRGASPVSRGDGVVRTWREWTAGDSRVDIVK